MRDTIIKEYKIYEKQLYIMFRDYLSYGSYLPNGLAMSLSGNKILINCVFNYDIRLDTITKIEVYSPTLNPKDDLIIDLIP